MKEDVYWLLELSIKPGGLERFRDLMEEMVAATQANEPGTLNYEWALSEDGRTCHIYERYEDSAAVMTHLGSFEEKFADRFMELLEPTRLVLYGNPSDEVKEALSGLSPALMAPIGGFAR